MKKVGIVMGSDSDLPVLEKAANTLKNFGVPFEMHVYSAHRTPEEARLFAANAKENGFGAIIAAAGKAAHLAGSIAANTTLPVIGIPVKSSTLDGWTRFCPPCRCPRAYPWRPWLSTARKTPRFWRCRSSPFPTKILPADLPKRERQRRKRFWRKTARSKKNTTNKSNLYIKESL